MYKSFFNLCFIFTIITMTSDPLLAQRFDMEIMHAFKARAIGPAGMSGRVTSIDVVLSEPDIIYVGTASGGLWRSTNGGIDWKPLFDDQPVASIGAVAVVAVVIVAPAVAAGHCVPDEHRAE